MPPPYPTLAYDKNSDGSPKAHSHLLKNITRAEGMPLLSAMPPSLRFPQGRASLLPRGAIQFGQLMA